MVTLSRNLLLGWTQLFVLLLGTVGNLLVVLVIVLSPRLRRNIHYYLVLHLAICDFSALLFLLSDVYNSFTGISMINSSVLCKLWRPAHLVFYSAGVLFMVIISIVRFQAVSNPFECAMNRSKVKLLAVLAYVFATIFTLPNVLVLQFNNKTGCVEEWAVEWLHFSYCLFESGVMYFIPVVLLSAVYGKMCIVLVKQNREMKLLFASAVPSQQQSLSAYQRLRQHRNVRTFLVCLTVVVSFAVTALPSHIMFILYFSNGGIEFPVHYHWFDVVYHFGVSAVNPFIYRTLDKKLFSSFMKRMRKLLSC
jgi:hypothetical protein